MSTRKRAAGASGSATPAAASKQQRVGDEGSTPLTSTRPHGRVLLDVGGQQFKSSRSTLEGSSSYFRSLLERWDEEADEPLFIDADADAFGVLLSHMRIASNIILPEDEKLCARVLLLAEYLGMDALLAKVKAKAYQNMHADDDKAVPALGKDQAAAKFDEEVGTLQEAIDSKVLPARYFAPVLKPPEPPERVVKCLIPAPPGSSAIFTDGCFYDHRAVDGDGDETAQDTMDVLSFAVVQLRDGTTRVEAVVQDTTDGYHLGPAEIAHPQLSNHLRFASEVTGWKHHLIVPPRSSYGKMLPISPGSIRGVWAKPAITKADRGKKLTVSESGAIIVGGEVRSATWGCRPIPSGIKDCIISGFIDGEGEDPRSQFYLSKYVWRQVPYLTGAANQIIKDISFVEIGQGELPTKFYIADTLGPKVDVFHSNRVVDVTQVVLPNDLQFSHTITTN